MKYFHNKGIFNYKIWNEILKNRYALKTFSFSFPFFLEEVILIPWEKYLDFSWERTNEKHEQLFRWWILNYQARNTKKFSQLHFEIIWHDVPNNLRSTMSNWIELSMH